MTLNKGYCLTFSMSLSQGNGNISDFNHCTVVVRLFFIFFYDITRQRGMHCQDQAEDSNYCQLPCLHDELKKMNIEKGQIGENDLTTVFSLNWLIFLWDTSGKVEEKQSCGRQTAASVSSLCFSVHQTDVWCSYNFVTSLWYSQTWRADFKASKHSYFCSQSVLS